MINLHSLTEESRISDVIYLQKKLHEYQRHVKSIANIATFLSFGLWNFPFGKYSLNPRHARKAAKKFREKFYKVPLALLSSASTKARRASTAGSSWTTSAPRSASGTISSCR